MDPTDIVEQCAKCKLLVPWGTVDNTGLCMECAHPTDLSTTIRNFTFTYCPASGGVVVTINSIPIDAGVINPFGSVTVADLERWADRWMARETIRIRLARRATHQQEDNQ